MILTDQRLPPYTNIDRLNEELAAEKRHLPLVETLRQLETSHQRTLAAIRTVPEKEFATETRLRRHLRMETYAHYAEHASSILEWRKAQGR